MQKTVQTVYHSSQPLHKHSHFHDCHQIILVVRGNVEFYVNDRHISASDGDIAIFSRYENHSVCNCSEEYERYVLHIDPDVVNQKSPVYSLLTDRPAGFCNVLNISSCKGEIIGLFKRMIVEHNSQARFSDELEQLLVKQLLVMVYRSTTVTFHSTYDDVVADLKRQFENNCQIHYNLDNLARKYSISPSSLSHRFQAATGVSVMEYLQSCRMANAKQLLADTHLSIGQIVERCGFSDNSNFSRAFKKMTGVSPSAFRKQYKAR